MNRTWYAFRVMLHQVRRDPLWALGCIIFYPLRLGVHALKVFFFSAFLTLALLALVEFAVDALSIKKTIIHSALNIGALLSASPSCSGPRSIHGRDLRPWVVRL